MIDMNRIAMINSSGLVVNVALWDGVSPWDPVAAGLCASIVDVSSNLSVSAGSTYANGVFTPPEPVSPAADPAAFALAVLSDPAITAATRLVVASWEPSLTVAIAAGNTAVISQVWALLVSQYSISADDRSAVAAIASAYSVPGIS